MKTRLTLLLVIGAVFFLATGCTDSTSKGASNLHIMREIPIPYGYEFVDASAFGSNKEHRTIYCMDKETKRYFICNDGKVGEEIVIPEGYELAGVSAWGDESNNRTFYCRDKESGKVFECS